jgi:hypothetical protein
MHGALNIVLSNRPRRGSGGKELWLCLFLTSVFVLGKFQLLSREIQPECPRSRGMRGSQIRCERLAEQITDTMWDRTRNAYS